MSKKAIIIGSGLAGLASAIRLANKGIETHIFEANSYPGGKINSKTIDGYRFDQGPSILTCPEYIEELYTLCGKDFNDFETVEQATAFNYFYEDGTQLELTKDSEQVIREISEKLGEHPEQVRKHLQKAKKNYQLIAPLFIEKSLHRWWTLFGKQLAQALLHLPSYKLFSTMQKENQGFFTNPRTVQLFNRFAQYNGSHPYRAPAMLNMISHLEINEGPTLPKNGSIQITDSLVQLAKEQGVIFHFNESVEEILLENKTVKGIKTKEGDYFADYIVSNMDVILTYKQLLKNTKQPKRTLQQEKSSSVIVYHLGIKKEFPKLNVHNMLFSDNDEAEFDAVFDQKEIHESPSLYLYISSKINATDSPVGCENWFVLLNAPINEGQDWKQIVADKKKYVLQKLSDLVGEDITPLVEVEDHLDPLQIEQRYNIEQGSIYGNASNSRFSAFYRHPNFSKEIKGLYFASGSAHPGGGMPLALNSAKIACDCLFSDYSL